LREQGFCKKTKFTGLSRARSAIAAIKFKTAPSRPNSKQATYPAGASSGGLELATRLPAKDNRFLLCQLTLARFCYFAR